MNLDGKSNRLFINFQLTIVVHKNQNYTILSVGFEAGFNSKTTFNTVFKKFTGVTPTEYRDQKRPVSVTA